MSSEIWHFESDFLWFVSAKPLIAMVDVSWFAYQTKLFSHFPFWLCFAQTLVESL